MIRRICSILLLASLTALTAFAQAGSGQTIRDYVGLINQTYHPDIVSYIEKFKIEFEKQGNSDAIKGVDRFLKGPFGTGFVYVAANGDNYIITNTHVIAQAYSLSITFEKIDGTKTRYDGIEIVAADEEADLALLAFPGGQKPFTEGLVIKGELVDEGTDVFSAGFPGLGGTPVYQFGRGIVSNAAARIPRNDNEEELMGPYIQHTAQIDAGNSGGPLLIAQAGAPAGYAVLAVNTLSAYRRQAANYSIPGNTVIEFINRVLDPDPVNEREVLEERINTFISEMNVPRAVYRDIAKYLSYVCVAENTEYAIAELEDKRASNRIVWNDIVETFNDYPINGMRLAVAWVVENAMRNRSGLIRISLNDLTEIGPGEYEASLDVNGTVIESRWIKEYGVWRINSFGSVAAGDKSLVEEKEKQRAKDAALFTDYALMLQVGYAQITDRGGGLNGMIRIGGRLFVDLGFVYAMDSDLLHTQAGCGFYIPIRLSGFAIMPLVEIAGGLMFTEGYKDHFRTKTSSMTRFGFSIQAGLMLTTAAVRGLYFYGLYQYNNYSDFDIGIVEPIKPDKSYILLGAGFGL
ncbi:MAG: serine protease [Spirochaetaceae bacterium]|nr:serine protease [Spirochaetaceae bacterium]